MMTLFFIYQKWLKAEQNIFKLVNSYSKPKDHSVSEIKTSHFLSIDLDDFTCSYFQNEKDYNDNNITSILRYLLGKGDDILCLLSLEDYYRAKHKLEKWGFRVKE